MLDLITTNYEGDFSICIRDGVSIVISPEFARELFDALDDTVPLDEIDKSRMAKIADLKFHQRLKFYRKENGFTLRQVARLARVSVPYLSQLENTEGKHPSAHLVWRLAQVYKIKMECLFKNY